MVKKKNSPPEEDILLKRYNKLFEKHGPGALHSAALLYLHRHYKKQEGPGAKGMVEQCRTNLNMRGIDPN